MQDPWVGDTTEDSVALVYPHLGMVSFQGL